MQKRLDQVIGAVKSIRAPFSLQETDLHAQVQAALESAKITYTHEAPVAPRCRVDFLAEGIGIEIKRGKPRANDLLNQATRYLSSPRVDALIIISERETSIPESILGKPCVALSFSKLWGPAVPQERGAVKPVSVGLLDSEPESIFHNPAQRPGDAVPAYLEPVRASDKVYGTLSYQARGKHWIISGEPYVTELAKRLFPGADSGRRGVARFSAHRRLVGELNWFMQRYPLAVMPRDQERWDSSLQEARDYQARLDAFSRSAPEYKNWTGWFTGQLRPFQAYGAVWLTQTRRALLADEMGLGKTVQALAALASTGGLPAIIVVPPHLVRNWQSEIKRFLSIDGREPVVCVLKGLSPYPLPEADIYLVHYLLLRGWKDALPDMPVKTVIFDEIQELRHRGTEKYSAASLLSNACERVYGLSGTPIYNQGGEIWNVINILDFHFLGDWDSFSREWCYGYGNAVVMHPDWLGDYLRREGVMLRRNKKDVLPELPDKRRLVQEIDADNALFQKLMAPVLDKLRYLSETEELSPSQRALLEGQVSQGERQATGLAKAPYVAQFVRAMLESGEKVLLFAHHHAVMDLYKKELRHFSPAFITGRETGDQKDKSVTRFMEERTNLCCVSLRAASGLNLQRATCVIFGELDWSPAIHSQAEDRAHRIGQKDSLLCYYLTSPGGSDSLIQDVLGLKVSQFLGLMGSQAPRAEDEAIAANFARQHVKDMMSRWLP
ncbi:MAG: DEAD/DEAH box helicase [Eubacteriales bacterium]|nr:DEAD/DEAH box helicase [Eubacteriales bacterium]